MTRSAAPPNASPTPSSPTLGAASAWPAHRGHSYLSAFQRLQEATFGLLAFDLAMARRFDIPPHAIHHHQRQGRLWSMGRGLFRFPDQGLPDDIDAVRIAAHHLGPDTVASHTTALFVHGCTDVLPERWEFTLLREKRYIARHGIRLHTTKAPLPSTDVMELRGLRVTTLTRSILDAAKSTGDLSQIEIAIYEGIVKGLLAPQDLHARRHEAGSSWWSIESGLKKYGRHASGM